MDDNTPPTRRELELINKAISMAISMAIKAFPTLFTLAELEEALRLNDAIRKQLSQEEKK